MDTRWCLPVDVPETRPNLTWKVTKPVAAGAQIDGFTATTRVERDGAGSIHGAGHAPVDCYPGAPPPERRVSRQKASKQALIGMLPTPSFLAGVK